MISQLAATLDAWLAVLHVELTPRQCTAFHAFILQPLWWLYLCRVNSPVCLLFFFSVRAFLLLLLLLSQVHCPSLLHIHPPTCKRTFPSYLCLDECPNAHFKCTGLFGDCFDVCFRLCFEMCCGVCFWGSISHMLLLHAMCMTCITVDMTCITVDMTCNTVGMTCNTVDMTCNTVDMTCMTVRHYG